MQSMRINGDEAVAFGHCLYYGHNNPPSGFIAFVLLITVTGGYLIDGSIETGANDMTRSRLNSPVHRTGDATAHGD